MKKVDSMLPKLIVFDLDRTIWPFQLDKQMKSPFHISNENKVIDSIGQEASLFHDTKVILHSLTAHGYKLGIASRIEDISGAYQLLNLFNLGSYFNYREIYPGNKRNHFNKLQEKSGIAFQQMLFFDDDYRNIRDVSKLGVICIQVPDGITHKMVAAYVP